jgi:serine/threonine protein kinase
LCGRAHWFETREDALAHDVGRDGGGAHLIAPTSGRTQFPVVKVQHSGCAQPRRENEPCEDAWAVSEGRGSLVAALADGVGASREGGLAAKRAVEMLTDHGVARPRAWSPRRALAEFTAQINRQLHQEAIERHGAPELTCTLSAVVLEGGRLYGCNLGDSPVYHWRRGKLSRLSEPHVVDEPGMHHVLTRAIGLEPHAEPHFFEADLADGDIVLLCSDGLTGAIDEATIAAALARGATARSLVLEARQAMFEREELHDDISAIVLEVTERGRPVGADAQRLEVLPLLRAGESVDGYTLVRPLADNDRVWLANDAAGASLVLKFPPPEAAQSEGLRDAFVREAWNAARLVAPEFVRAWSPAEGALRYYAMEFVSAPTLGEVLERGGVLSVDDARELARFLLRAGQYLLRHDLAHGDIKPDNILVLRDSDAAAAVTFKLLDFGSAAELFSVTSRAGTPSYLAPERFQGAALAERTEIFAIGVTVYQALTRIYPYGEVERFQTPRFDNPPRRPAKLNPAVPDWFESILLRALEVDGERRYQNFSEMAFDLEQPGKVVPYHRKDAPLLERNPIRFYQLMCLLLLTVIAGLVAALMRK